MEYLSLFEIFEKSGANNLHWIRLESNWEHRSNKYILIGYSDKPKAYRLWKVWTKIVIKSRNVNFIENELYANTNSEEHMQFYDFEIKYKKLEDVIEVDNEIEISEEPQNDIETDITEENKNIANCDNIQVKREKE